MPRRFCGGEREDGKRSLRGLRSRRNAPLAARLAMFEHRHLGQDFGNHVGHLFALDLRLGPDDQAMAEHAEGDRLHVLVGEVVPAVQQRPGPGAPRSRHRRPAGSPQRNVRVPPARLGQIARCT